MKGDPKQVWQLKERMDTRAREGSRIAEAHRRAFSDKAHYWPEHSLPYARAMACVQIVLLHGQADHAYSEVKAAWARLDWSGVVDEFIDAWFDGGCDELVKRHEDDADFQRLISSIHEFIKVGFNRKSEDNENWKVQASLDTPLFPAVGFYSLGDFGGALESWNEYRPFVRAGRVVDTGDVMTHKPNDRTHRKLVSYFQQFGKLIHDTKMLDMADHWYESRVEYAGPEEFSRENYRQHGIWLDPGNISNEIRPMDDAVGYTRKSRE